MAYACGQLCSMTIRSGILAATFGDSPDVRTLRLGGNHVWALFRWLWSLAPLLLAFLIVTWLHAPNWLLERRTWRTRLRPALVIGVPVMAILVAIPLVRLYEIPLVGPGFNVEEMTGPIPAEEQETLALYERAIEFLRRPSQSARETGAPAAAPRWPPTCRHGGMPKSKRLRWPLEASRRPLLESFPEPGSGPDPSLEIGLADLVLANGKRLQSEGKLDKALDRYLAAGRIAGLDVVRQHGHGRIWARGLEHTFASISPIGRRKADSVGKGARRAAKPGKAMADSAFLCRRRRVRLSIGPSHSLPGR